MHSEDTPFDGAFDEGEKKEKPCYSCDCSAGDDTPMPLEHSLPHPQPLGMVSNGRGFLLGSAPQLPRLARKATMTRQIGEPARCDRVAQKWHAAASVAAAGSEDVAVASELKPNDVIQNESNILDDADVTGVALDQEPVVITKDIVEVYEAPAVEVVVADERYADQIRRLSEEVEQNGRASGRARV